MGDESTVSRARAGARLSLIPTFAAEIRGVAAQLPLGAQRLVAYLALHGRAIQRSAAAARLWPDLTVDRAAGAMRSAVWQTRRRAPGLIASDAQSVRLGGGVEVDLSAAVATAHRLRDGDSEASDVEAFGHDLLTEWHDDWVVVERERYRQIRLHAMEELSRRLLAAGSCASAIDVALGAVAADPLRETAQRALIEAHIADGNVSEAIRQYRSFAAVLRTQLGVEPTSELSSLLPRRR